MLVVGGTSSAFDVGLTSLSLAGGVDEGGGWLERLSLFAWAAVRNGGAKGVPEGSNTLATSLGSGEREVKGGEQ